MKIENVFRGIFLFGLPVVWGCGGGGDSRFSVFQHPVDVRASAIDLSYDGRTTRFVYVANETGGSVAVIDQDSESLADTDAEDELEGSPIIVGGSPVAVAVSDRGSVPRVFAADAEHNELWAFDAVPPADRGKKEIAHDPVNLGGATVGRASRPIYQESGRKSTPALVQVSVDSTKAKNEQWEVRFVDGNNYRVKGSKSGEQVGRAYADTPYTTDDGAVSFTVQSGVERTTGDDRFLFGTVVAQPLSLSSRPVDLQIDSNRLYIVQTRPAIVSVLNLDTLLIEATLSLSDGGSVDAEPGRSSLGGGHLYVSNQATGNIFDLDLASLAVAPVPVGLKTRAVGADATAGTLYLIPTENRSVSIWDLSQGAIASVSRINDIGFDFSPFERSDGRFGLVPTASGGVEVFNLETRSRVDTRITGDNPQSTETGKEFFDVGPTSAPELIAVNTMDGVTRSERWQLVFEGVVPGTANLSANVNADQVTVSGGSFITDGVVSGDHLLLSSEGDAGEVEIAEVLSEESLRLSSAPTQQGTVTVEVRPNGEYVVVGSLSGAQKGRVVEGVSYTSDDGAIALTIRSSRTKPTTHGDYFTFVTLDGIDPIFPSSKRGGRSVAVFTRPRQVDATAYVTYPEDNNISVIDLRSLEERRTIR
ncbi:MAG TPA: hypothetical protein VI895_11095 [Bdellovibrionota bacterium]|nr:hypothetical protein [Bdellovibrionota bacterium]